MAKNISEYDIKLSISSKVFLAVFSSLEIFIGSIANFAVIVTIFNSRQLRGRSEDRLILNLAIVDFLSLTIILPWHIYVINLQKINDMTARSNIGYNTTMTLFSSAVSHIILSIAVDRFVAVVYPFRHRAIINTHIMTVLSWGTALLIALGDFFAWKSTFLSKCADIFIVTYGLLIMAVITIIYVIIFYCTLKQSRKILKQKRSIVAEHADELSSQLVMKTTLKTFALMCLFYATYLLLIAYIVHFSFVKDSKWTERWNVRIWIFSLFFFNSCVNPFIYGLRTKRFRKEFQKRIGRGCFIELQTTTRINPLQSCEA